MPIAIIPVGKRGVVSTYLKLDWGLLDIIFGQCDLVTMCAIRDSHPSFREVVDATFTRHGGKIVGEFGREIATILATGELESNCYDAACRKCKRRKRMILKLAKKFAGVNLDLKIV